MKRHRYTAFRSSARSQKKMLRAFFCFTRCAELSTVLLSAKVSSSNLDRKQEKTCPDGQDFSWSG